jgi:C-terminal processing protease CtpA/Prc
MSELISAPLGRQLYHAVWKLVLEEYFDSERMAAADWPALEHHFDDRIVDDTSALACAQEALALLKDDYTRIMPPEELAEKVAAREDDSQHVFSRVYPRNGINVGYIKIDSFSNDNIVVQVKERLSMIAHCDAFVVDLIGNGGGLIDKTANCLEFFIEESGIASIEYRDGPVKTERYIFFTKEHYAVYMERTGQEPEKDLFLRQAPLIAGKPMAVLFNRTTASSAEMFAAALVESGTTGTTNGQPNKVFTFGFKTGGKGIGQSDFDVLGRATLKMSHLRFSSATGQWFGDHAQTVSNGLVPEVTVGEDDTLTDVVNRAVDVLVHLERDKAQMAA